MKDLVAEWVACDQLNAAQFDQLRGISIDLGPFLTSALIGTALVQRDGSDRFSFDPAGRLAFITPIRAAEDGDWETISPAEAVVAGALVDLVAWHPARPGRWALRRGSAIVLGAVGPQLIDPPAVPIHRTIVGWMRAGAEGLVLLSTDWRDRQHVLQRLVHIASEDAGHARELRRDASRPWPVPVISIASMYRRAAA